MTSDSIDALAGRLMRHPAVPYHEFAVRSEAERICNEHGLQYKCDQFGNLLVRLEAARRRPLVLAAHLDHPGFEIIRRLSDKSWLARFQGGVPDTYFRKAIPVRLMPGDVRARLGRRIGAEREFEISAARPVKSEPAFAVWDLIDFSVRGQRICGRACDDLIGVASILATMIRLKQERAAVNVLGVISRAEEVGFHGALACAASGRLPKDSLVISLETSRELPGVKMGQGVILRVGDRTSIFGSEPTRFLAEVATELAATQKNFKAQRALMSGGTCEATAYQEFGFQTAGVCVALGNYHNCAARNQIRAEYVSGYDVSTMVDLLCAAARAIPRYSEITNKLPRRLERMLIEARGKLSASS